MFEFRDGQQYSLSTESGSNKSVLFVKLTDSALHSIESYLHAKDEGTKPTIQFEGNNGTITVPQNGQKILYGFTLSNLKVDGSSFQCLQHTSKKCVKSLSSMHIKMQVHANEDSYANTKCKMAAAEKEQKSLCTKEIKPNGKCFSKKSSFKCPGGVFPIKAVPFVKAQEHSGFLKPRVLSNKPMLSKQPIRKKQNYLELNGVSTSKKQNIVQKLKVNKSESFNEPQSKRQRTSFNNKHKRNEKHTKASTLRLNCVLTVNTNGLLDDLKIPSSTQVNGHHSQSLSLSNGNSSQFKLSAVLSNGSPGLSPDFESNSSSDRSSSNGTIDSPMERGRKDTELNPPKYDGSPISKFAKSLPYVLPRYVKITSYEQRAEYARHFNSMYTDYLKLHEKLKEVSQRLSYLENQMNDSEKGSEDYELYRHAIMKIYKETAHNDRYRLEWKRYQIYQKALEQIKKLVLDYDNEES